MFKKSTIFIVALTMILSTAFIATPVVAVDQSQVCGLDGNNYASAEAAEAAGVEVSYEFACVNSSSETNLYEAMTDIHFVGALVEIGSTDVPTTIIIRPNEGGVDRTVNVTSETVMGQRRDQYTNLSDWIPGDQIRVIGKNNENTDVIEATILVNHSIVMHGNLFHGANGWITAIDKDAKKITYQWNNIEHVFAYDDDTRFVAAGKNPATVDDLEINDRIRGRLIKRTGETPIAKIVVVLRRGNNLFMKIRTFRPNATLVRMDNPIVPTTIQVKMENTPGIKANDVNNLIGEEGTLITVNVNEHTRLVRKYFGKTTLEEFSVGDKLAIVGRINDDGTVDAKLIKNNSIWQTSTQGHAGVITEINTSDNYIMVNWTPVQYQTINKLINILKEKQDEVTAQALNLQAVKAELQRRIKAVEALNVGKFERNVVYKKVIIDRIKQSNVQLNDLIKRMPTKKIRVDITSDTVIVVGTNNNATINDLQNGDKVRIRGIRHRTLDIVTANTIVVVNSLPEIEEPLNTSLDEVNEVVSVIETDDTDNAIVEDTTTDTEEEIDTNSEG